MAVIYLDLDGFKRVNDAMGHVWVTSCWCSGHAAACQAVVRQTDTVCRQGGDEFVLLLPAIGGAEQAGVVARKLMQQCVEPFVLQGVTLSLGLSGASACTHSMARIWTNSRHADAAMYAAKQAGRNQIRQYQGPQRRPAWWCKDELA